MTRPMLAPVVLVACALLIGACSQNSGFDSGPGTDAAGGMDVTGDASRDDIPNRDGTTVDAGDAVEMVDAVEPFDVGLAPVTELNAPGTPPDARMRFGGAEDPARAPSIVYPSDGTIVPPNLAGLEVHFRAGTGNDVFRVSFTGASAAIQIYTGCNVVADGCALVLDAMMFDLIARASRPGGEVRITVEGSSAAASGRFGRSPAHTLGVTASEPRGGIYYWSAIAGNIMRFEFGRANATAEVYQRGGDPFNCLGCHTLSRDGQMVSIGRFIPSPSRMQTYDVATRMTRGAEYAANFATFSPDNTRQVISDGARMTLLDPATGTSVPGLAAGYPGTMPDWSADGRTVVFSRPGVIGPIGGPGHGAPADLLIIPWDGSAFGTNLSLVRATGENNYYPSFSPDNEWVLFNRSAGQSSSAIDAHLYVTRADRSGTPIRLAAADSTGDLCNSWPKWAPFVQVHQGEPILWLTFSTKRDYGLRLRQQASAPDDRRVQLWMAAFRPGRAATGDPSAPAFWLPFQSMTEGNHIAQWVQQVRRQTCAVDSDCAAGETCVVLAARGSCVGH